MTYSLALPFHGDLTSIVPTVRRVLEEGPAHGIREVLLCHNGRPLGPEAQAKVEALVTPRDGDRPPVRLLDTDAKGIGAGYKLGIREATEEFLVLSADDLPFGWSDITAFEDAGSPDFAIGSKAHPRSKLEGVTIKRRISSFAFLGLRRLLLGWGTPGDSQGSFIIRTSVAKQLLADLVYDHYLFTLELVTLHLRRGGRVVEVPISVQHIAHESSVSVASDGWRMTKELVALRRRMSRQR